MKRIPLWQRVSTISGLRQQWSHQVSAWRTLTRSARIPGLSQVGDTIPALRRCPHRTFARRTSTRSARSLGFGQAGDTIVEVLIAIGIISLVVTAAYVTANRSYLTMQDAQERGNALKLAERQIENLKAYSVNNGADLRSRVTSETVCMTSDAAGSPIVSLNNGHTDGSNLCLFAPDATTALAGTQPAYSVVITRNTTTLIGSGNLYVITVTWDSVLGDGHNTIKMEYGVY